MTKGNRNEVKILFIKIEIEVTVIFSKNFLSFNLIYLRRNLVNLDTSKYHYLLLSGSRVICVIQN